MSTERDHNRIWLEPTGAPDRCWCEDNQWGEEGVEYVRASLLETVAAERDALQKQVSERNDWLQFVARWAWDKTGPADERLSCIQYYPPVKAARLPPFRSGSKP